MPRTIEVAAPANKAEELLRRLEGRDGVVGLARQRDTSLNPPGDIVTIHATNDGTRTVLETLEELDLGDGGSIVTTEPRSLMSSRYQNGIDRETNETIWDEMAFLLRRETNVAGNYLAAMALSGAVAAVGLWTNTLHIVIGAMVIAPGFEPLLRMPFGWVAGPRNLASRGLLSTLVGYALLAIGAALTLLLLRILDPASSQDLETRSWVRYWSTVTGSSIVLALAAGAAGAVVVAAQRSVLTAGVMIALALIPGMSIAGMAVATGDFDLAGRGLIRWLVDAVAVVIAGLVVLGFKQAFIHRRRALS